MAPLLAADGALKSSLGITGIVNVMKRGEVAANEDVDLDVITGDCNDPLLSLATTTNENAGRMSRPMMTTTAATGSGIADREFFLIVVDVMVSTIEV